MTLSRGCPILFVSAARRSSGSGRFSALASSHGARIHTSHSSSVVRITGFALG
jgi:hypothetical protein